ncbi:hypothetical protein Bbelb_051160 [Branchiostoma belcheri]|nr:hypothetical protein Bbelb_051160 [Branchiostoma belcheri]
MGVTQEGPESEVGTIINPKDAPQILSHPKDKYCQDLALRSAGIIYHMRRNKADKLPRVPMPVGTPHLSLCAARGNDSQEELVWRKPSAMWFLDQAVTLKERKVLLTTGGSRIVVKVGGCSSTQHREQKGTPTWQTVALNHTDVCTEAHSVTWYGVGETLVALYRQRQPPGFYGHMATKGCGKCLKLFSRNSDNRVDYSGFEEEDPLRSHEEHCSSLHDLPYFDAVRRHVIDPMHNLLEGTAKRVMQTFETPGQSRVRTSEGTGLLPKLTRKLWLPSQKKRVAIFETSDDGKELMRRCGVEAKLPALVFKMPGGHQVVLTTAENTRRGQVLREMPVNIAQHYQRTCSAKLGFAVLHGDTAHGKQLEILWTSRASDGVLQPIQNQPEAAMASWQLEHPTPTEGDSGDWTVAMKRVIKNILHYVGEDPELSATGPVTTPRWRLAPTGQASTSTAPTARDDTGTTDPTPTGYKDGETESLDDSTPGFSLLTDVRLSLSPSPTVTEPTNPPSTWTPTPSSPGALLPVPKKRRLAASPRKPSARIKVALHTDTQLRHRPLIRVSAERTPRSNGETTKCDMPNSQSTSHPRQSTNYPRQSK